MKSKLPSENINENIKGLDAYLELGLSVDCVIFSYNRASESLQVLTIVSKIKPYAGRRALMGDLVEPAEDLDAAAARVVRERANITDLFLQQVHTFGAVDRHPAGRVITVAYYSFIGADAATSIPDNPHHPKWVPFPELLNCELAFDHKKILSHCVKHIQNHILDLPVETMLPDSFTLSELQSLYEAILQKKLDKRNFRKKILKLDLLKKTAKTQKNVAHRPAQLYTFNPARKGLEL